MTPEMKHRAETESEIYRFRGVLEPVRPRHQLNPATRSGPRHHEERNEQDRGEDREVARRKARPRLGGRRLRARSGAPR